MMALNRKLQKDMKDRFVWKPLYPNNMKCNGLDGYYCLVIRQRDDGTYYGRKYTIEFQHKEIEPGTGYVDSKTIDRYVLFEKIYPEIIGNLEYPEPTNESPEFFDDNKNTLDAHDVNSYGSFVYAYETLELAKKRAETQWNHIYGYVASFLGNNSK